MEQHIPTAKAAPPPAVGRRRLEPGKTTTKYTHPDSWRVLFSPVLSSVLSLPPRIVAYTEKTEEARGGATRSSLNPGRPLRYVTWPGRGAASAARRCGENGALFEETDYRREGVLRDVGQGPEQICH